jgi:phage gpG-like protein
MAISVQFTGRGASLGDVVNGFRGLGRPGWPQSLNKVLGVKTLELTLDLFRNGESPYGQKWAPITHRKGQIMRKTGRLMASLNSKVVGNVGFKIGTNVAYAAQRNFGGEIKPVKGKYLVFKIGRKKVFARSVKQPARPFMPTLERGVPAQWMRLYTTTASTMMQTTLRSTRK